MNQQDEQRGNSARRDLGWPAAATLITGIVGAAVTSLAWAVVPESPSIRPTTQTVVSVREIGEMKARLMAIEESSNVLRAELRSDIKEVREMVQQLLKETRP